MPIPAVGWGALGVVAFSMTLPAIRAALPGFGPVTVGVGRAVPAAALAGAALLIVRAPLPTQRSRAHPPVAPGVPAENRERPDPPAGILAPMSASGGANR